MYYVVYGGDVDVVNFLIDFCVDVIVMLYEGKFVIDVVKGEGIVFILVLVILRVGKEYLLFCYMDELILSLESL